LFILYAPNSRLRNSSLFRSARERAEQHLRHTNSVMGGSEAGEQHNGSMEYEHCSSHGSVSGTQDQHWERQQSLEVLGPHGMDISEHVLAEILPTSSLPSAAPAMIPPTSSRTKSWIQIQSPLASVPLGSSGSNSLPRVFVPLPRHLGSPDISYLRSRDALNLPSESLQVELLKAYVEYVHPTMPVLDLEEFLSSVKYGYESFDGQRGRGIERENAMKKQISLLLFQAVMFAAVSYVPLRSLKDAGYGSREAAKCVFFSRARLCYDFDTCTDRQAIIQALLLMTLSPVSESKDAYHWLGLAISLSYSLGLNRGTSNQTTSVRKKRLERRIWWTTFISDRTLALNTNGATTKPVRIRADDCDVGMLCLADFDLTEEPNDMEEEGGEEMKARQNALSYIQKAKICWCSSNVSVMTFGTHCPPVETSKSTQSIAIPDRHFMHEEQIYTASSCTTSTPVFESSDDMVSHLAHSSPATSSHDEPTTPQVCPESTVTAPQFKQSIMCEEGLGGGFGVDGEYDDYLEFLRPSGGSFGVSEMEKNRPRDSWAFQFDCENDRVLEV